MSGQPHVPGGGVARARNLPGGAAGQVTGRSSRLHDHPGAASRVTAAVPLARSPDPLVLLVRVPSGVPLVAAEQVVDLVLGEFRLRPWPLIMPPTAASSSLAEPDEARSCSRNELKPTSSFGGRPR
jgi:hypothetical protein